MKFLVEDIDKTQTSIIEEAAEDGKRVVYIEGVFAQSEIGNRNGRIYPKGIMEAAIQSQLKKIAEGSAMGELNHPNTPNVNPERASHVITKLEWRGNDVHGRARLLDEDYFPAAKVAKGMVKEGIKFGVSTRGLGSVRKNAKGLLEVQKDFKMICIDIVTDPSGPDCWVNGIMENQEWAMNPVTGQWELVEQIQKEISQSKKLTFEQKRELFQKYMNGISGR